MPHGQRGGGIRLAHDDEEDDFDRYRFPAAFHALISWPRFAERGIVSGRSVDLEQVDHKYLTDLLVGYGSGGLMDLPEVVYPDLVRMFYNNVELKGRGFRTHLRFYLKGKWYTLNHSMFASIFDIELRDTFAYFVTNADLKDVADSMGEGMLNSIIRSICVTRDTPGGIVRKDLEPHLYLFHVWILENVLPKAGHLDAVFLDLPYIIMKEISRIKEADDNKALRFGALLTKICKAFDIDLEDEEWTPTQGPISHAAVISSKISEKIAARQHDRLQGGGAADAPPVVPPPPAHVPAPAPIPAQFSQFQHAVMERLDAFDRRFTQIRADSLRSSNSMARIQADQATQQSRIHSLSVAQAQMGSVLSEMRTDIATSKERVLQSIKSLTQLFRRRFPSPSADP
ncbi:hypothetical protein Dimus_031695 [Dionaea muscipula]